MDFAGVDADYSIGTAMGRSESGISMVRRMARELRIRARKLGQTGKFNPNRHLLTTFAAHGRCRDRGSFGCRKRSERLAFFALPNRKSPNDAKEAPSNALGRARYLFELTMSLALAILFEAPVLDETS